MLDELQRILNNYSAVANARSAWIQYVPKIISQAQLEKGVRVSSRCSSLIINESDGELIKSVYVLRLPVIPYSEEPSCCTVSSSLSSAGQ